jgi:cobalt-zinc-cadmium efflux system membrane fusion protein
MSRTFLLILALTSAGACAKTESADADSAKPAVDPMAGMDMPSTKPDSATSGVTFSAAQIEHGRVAWVPLSEGMFAGTVRIPGQLVANEDRTARVAAPAESRVMAIHVNPGDWVEQGARLATLQSRDASMASADVAKARAALTSQRAAATYARGARARAERLLALKAISRQELERAIADDDLASAGVAQADAEVKRAIAAAEALGVDPSDGSMTLRSPLAGSVVTRDAVPGAVLGAGAPVVTLTDPSSLWLSVAVPEQFAPSIRTGARLRFVVPSFPQDTFAARVQSVSASFDATTRSLPVRAVVANAGRRLRPEMFVDAWLEGGEQRRAVAVPDSAIQRLDGKAVVFVAHPSENGGAHFEVREIVIGGSNNGTTAILSGVKAGETVVVRGAYAVKAQLAKAKMPKMEM